MTELQQLIKLLEREKNIFKVVKDPDENGFNVTIFEYNSSRPNMVTTIEFDDDEKMVGTIGTAELFDDEEFEEFANMYRQSSWYEERIEKHWGKTMEYRYGKPTVNGMCETISEIYDGQDSVFQSVMEICADAFESGKVTYEDCLQLFYQLVK